MDTRGCVQEEAPVFVGTSSSLAEVQAFRPGSTGGPACAELEMEATNTHSPLVTWTLSALVHLGAKLGDLENSQLQHQGQDSAGRLAVSELSALGAVTTAVCSEAAGPAKFLVFAFGW